MANLTPKQQRFVEEYLIDLNGTRAYIRAGYAVKDEDTAAVMSSRLLRNDKVQEAIAEAQAEREERTKIDADYVLKRLVEIDQMDVLDIMDENLNMKPLKEWPKIWRQYINNIESIELSDGEGWLKKIKWPDKVKNLELIGKHVSVGAFKDKVEHSGQLEIQSLSSLMDELSKED
ncbi:terminase small subunit [Acinetobacter haemolyticus]|uniref:terminase small subunit n=1 Tax=Acinetobacter haemolyticus TaxID=29430 RepID=UPI001331E8D9|nr:terminase small subunit [Acinetobacter haemolyticus]QHI16232.1 terminase small subunit [Acinetobacter haemolyticus]QHI17083.1 terminase small subunit [Acinetobacter haemolyticus]